ncbi:hypothetical protein SCHPADRAFT_464258 [Schizopora paradoxa]|uniref:F-box domain-containing protein n=1 Tax=Schizopora paradoxa TaxID=27342 RepID=A0A0H2RJ27_9AGAM|nr:hypothetical protein SCHPADRAFT_464258 [Schizopora paradoxa]
MRHRRSAVGRIVIGTESLTSLTLNFFGPPPRRPITIDPSLCPQLKVLEVRNGVELTICGLHTHFLKNLDSLCLHVKANRDIPILQQLLAASFNIRCLEIRVWMVLVPRASTVETTLLFPSLTHLTISSGNPSLTLQFFEWLECPSLTHFAFSALQYIDDLQVTNEFLLGFERFLFRARPRLRCLALQVYRHWNWQLFCTRRDDSDMPSQASSKECARLLRRILGTLGGLESLRLSGVIVDEKLVEDMTFLKGGDGVNTGVPCPRLKTLDVSCEHLSVSPRTLVEMITSRFSPGGTLKSVCMCLPSDYEKIEETRREELENFVNETIDFTIKYYMPPESASLILGME